ncbi:hypothetical protein GCM10023205_61630 [Yinghuangia aomiensis]|uniref:Uncharacterized protein n=1 Tax=Yinghuangia aomiensis TaxID=676205 RepID=A0ABP9I010_9ACTN
MAVTLIRQAEPAAGTAGAYALADEAVNRLLRFRQQVGRMTTLVAELEARYGPAEGWDTRTWDEYEHRTEAAAWRQAAGLFGGGE